MFEIYYQGFSQIIILHLLIALFEQSKKFGFSYKLKIRYIFYQFAEYFPEIIENSHHRMISYNCNHFQSKSSII